MIQLKSNAHCFFFWKHTLLGSQVLVIHCLLFCLDLFSFPNQFGKNILLFDFLQKLLGLRVPSWGHSGPKVYSPWIWKQKKEKKKKTFCSPYSKKTWKIKTRLQPKLAPFFPRKLHLRAETLKAFFVFVFFALVSFFKPDSMFFWFELFFFSFFSARNDETKSCNSIGIKKLHSKTLLATILYQKLFIPHQRCPFTWICNFSLYFFNSTKSSRTKFVFFKFCGTFLKSFGFGLQVALLWVSGL